MRNSTYERPGDAGSRLPNGQSAVSMTEDATMAGLQRAYRKFLKLYAEVGGHNFHGFQDYDDPRNYKGPALWSEGDCQYRFALTLESTFRGMVHLEVPLARWSVHDYDPKIDRRQFIDIVVSDVSDFDIEKDVFSARAHDLFVEVKYMGHSGPKWAFDSRRRVRHGVSSDLVRLKRNLERGRCRVAAMLIVDDDSHLEGSDGAAMPWSPDVVPLLVSPTQLARLGWAKQLRVKLPPACPGCGSPRIAPILWGMPSPEVDEAAKRNELVCSGCSMFGYDLDPTYRCLDCRFEDTRFDPATEEYPPVRS